MVQQQQQQQQQHQQHQQQPTRQRPKSTSTTTTASTASRSPSPSSSAPRTFIMLCMFSTVLAVASLFVVTSPSPSSMVLADDTATASSSGEPLPPPLSSQEVRELLADIRDEDLRTVRWDATKHTRTKQKEEGHCGSTLVRALRQLLETDTTDAANSETVADVCEYATFCITDNPKQRELFANFASSFGDDPKRLYRRIVDLVLYDRNPRVSAMASHLIYSTAFANRENHQGYIRAGAVAALSTIIKQSKHAMHLIQPTKTKDRGDEGTEGGLSQETTTTGTGTGTPAVRADQVMWAAAALQNLAASYCAGTLPRDGRCYWNWAHNYEHVTIEDDDLPVFSDGTTARKLVLRDAELIERLKELSCMGPISTTMREPTQEIPFVGDNAVIGVHDDVWTIVPWAATGVLKNVAIEPESQPALDEIASCLCLMFHSRDWLEQNKGHGAIRHLRWDDPCWYEVRDESLCVDFRFMDEDGFSCADYGDPSDEDCQSNQDTFEDEIVNEIPVKYRPGQEQEPPAKGEGETSSKKPLLAKEACCGCGGGTSYDERGRITSIRGVAVSSSGDASAARQEL